MYTIPILFLFFVPLLFAARIIYKDTTGLSNKEVEALNKKLNTPIEFDQLNSDLKNTVATGIQELRLQVQTDIKKAYKDLDDALNPTVP